jgi:hypothetical protein
MASALRTSGGGVMTEDQIKTAARRATVSKSPCRSATRKSSGTGIPQKE